MKKGFLSLVFVLLTVPAVQAQPAAGQSKFLGNILSTSRTDENFATYWNQVTPEDNGKLGYVEATQGVRNWSVLDATYQYAQEHGFPFKEHRFVCSIPDALAASRCQRDHFVGLQRASYLATESVSIA